MRRLLLAITFLLCTLTVVGQEERVTVSDLPGMVNRGLKVIERSPYRYTLNIEGNKTLTLEVDAKGSIRVKGFDSRTGVISECIIIGGRIYHRSGHYPWISQTKDEFEKAQVALTAAIKEAKAKKDTETFERARAATLYNPAIFQALLRPTTNAVVAAATESRVSDKTIAFIGNLPYKDKVARFYRLRMSNSEFTPPSVEIRMVRWEIDYAFDQETGALLNAQTRSERVYESTTKAFFITDEWEPDPSIVITAPALTSPE